MRFTFFAVLSGLAALAIVNALPVENLERCAFRGSLPGYSAMSFRLVCCVLLSAGGSVAGNVLVPLPRMDTASLNLVQGGGRTVWTILSVSF
ncbi:hypothetical protein OG21DRAFT_1507646 [Imleria badia]|nr:hypothetical protein OG21DRAFT_1507646 [Imleria badia]